MPSEPHSRMGWSRRAAALPVGVSAALKIGLVHDDAPEPVREEAVRHWIRGRVSESAPLLPEGGSR